MELQDNKLLVSIIMPAYNVQNYIKQSIKSVIGQSYENWELLIIDDGSTDLTADICKKYADLDNRVIYLYQNNSKQASARNKGISFAQGQIIAFLDADDIWLSNKLEISLQHFNLKNFDLIFTDSYYGEDIEIENPNFNLKKMNIQDLEYSDSKSIVDFIKYNRIPILTVLIKKDVLQEIGLFDENCVPAEDYDLWLRLLKKGFKFKSISIPLSIYRIQQFSSTASDRLATNAVIKSIMKNFTSSEIKEMEVHHLLDIWVKRWIYIYLNKSNLSELKSILFHFNKKNILTNIIFFSYKLFGFKIFKRLILRFL